MKTLGEIAYEAAWKTRQGKAAVEDQPPASFEIISNDHQVYWETIAKAVAEAARKRSGHAGDCDFYSSTNNHCITDGICTCGYGKQYLSEHDGDHSQMYSKELLESLGGKIER